MVLHHRESSTDAPLATMPIETMVHNKNLNRNLNSPDSSKVYRKSTGPSNGYLNNTKKVMKCPPFIDSFPLSDNHIYFSEGKDSFRVPPRGHPVLCNNKFNTIVDYASNSSIYNEDGHKANDNNYVKYENEKKNNRLCSGYFCSFIVPPV